MNTFSGLSDEELRAELKRRSATDVNTARHAVTDAQAAVMRAQRTLKQAEERLKAAEARALAADGALPTEVVEVLEEAIQALRPFGACVRLSERIGHLLAAQQPKDK